MEVHAHAHTPRKKWIHYFWEFVMLFLAVFCGFLAEYQLEHTIEHQREKQYAKELYAELFADSVAVSDKIKLRLDKEKDMDYLSNYIRDSSLTSLPREFYPAYTTVMYLANTYAFEPKDGILSSSKVRAHSGILKTQPFKNCLGISVFALTMFVTGMNRNINFLPAL